MTARRRLTKSEAGRLGGLETAHRRGVDGMAAIGSRGGAQTVANHGKGHMARLAFARWGRSDLMRLVGTNEEPAGQGGPSKVSPFRQERRTGQ